MKKRISTEATKSVRCAIYTRKSTEEGLDQEFNSLDAQRESAEAFIVSQRHEGWEAVAESYDDGGFTGGNMERPALKRLLADIKAGKIDCVIVYKVDRLSRSLMDFARIIEIFDSQRVSFVSVTQQFNTATSMGRLVLNVLLSFAQFEREMISERVRDKVAASRRRGKWSGGMPLLGYTVESTKLVVDEIEAASVRQIFELYLEHQSLLPTVRELNRRGWTTKRWVTKKGDRRGGRTFTRNALYKLLTNVTYIGKIKYKDETHEGEHAAIVPVELFDRVQNNLRRNGLSGGTLVRNKHSALLKGLLHCQSCGCVMTHSFSCKGNKRYRYYVCGTSMQRGWSECPAPSVPAGEIERFVVDQIRTIGKDPELLKQTTIDVQQCNHIEYKRLRDEQKSLARQMRDDHAKLQAIVANPNIASNSSGLSEIQSRLETADRRSQQITSELTALDAKKIDAKKITDVLAGFDELWQSLPPKEQVRLVRLLIESVRFDGPGGNVAITFHPTGLKKLKREPTGARTMTERLTINRPFHVAIKRSGTKQMQSGAIVVTPAGRVPRISRLLALAHHCFRLVQSGAIINQSELAHFGQISTTRMTQIMWLDNLAPDIQEEILFLPRTMHGRDAIKEADIRPLAKTLDWNKQRQMWRELKKNSQSVNPAVS